MFWIFILLYLILLNCGSFIPERAESSQDWHSSRLSCVRASFVQGRSPGASETLHPAPGRGFLSGLSSDIFSVHRAIRLETESQDGGFVQLLWCSTLFLFVFWWQVNQVSIKNTDAKRKREREKLSNITLEGDCLNSGVRSGKLVTQPERREYVRQLLSQLGDKNHKTGSNLLNLPLDGWVCMWGQGWQEVNPTVGIQVSASQGGNPVA